MVRRYRRKTAKPKARKTFRKRFKKLRYARARVSRMPYSLQYINVKRTFDFTVPNAVLNRTVDGTGYGCFPHLLTASGSGTANTYLPFVFDFRQGDVPGISAYGTLFDQFKLKRVSLKFTFIGGTNNDMALNTVVATPITYYNRVCNIALVNDYDDISPFTSNDAGWEALNKTGRQKLRTFPNSRGNTFYHSLVPKTKLVIKDNTGADAEALVIGPRWEDGGITNVSTHLGIKGLIQVPPYAYSGSQAYHYCFQIQATYYFGFKSRK